MIARRAWPAPWLGRTLPGAIQPDATLMDTAMPCTAPLGAIPMGIVAWRTAPSGAAAPSPIPRGASLRGAILAGAAALGAIRRYTIRPGTLPRGAAVLAAVLLGAALAQPAHAVPAPGAPGAPGRGGEDFRFGVIGNAFKNGADDTPLRQALRASEQAGLAFVVANGIKNGAEPCADQLYGQRRELLDDSARPLIVSLAAGDWSACHDKLGRPVAVERLNRLRELFFGDTLSLGTHKISVARLSIDAKFRGYAENAHWEHGRVLFATINLPADNNHFRPEAGGNSEFEDRQVANRAWLRRLFTLAQRKRLDAVVLFSDGAVGAQREANGAPVPDRQDGYASTRRELRALTQKFPGQVLLVDAQGAAAGAPAIVWRDNVGHLSVGQDWIAVRVNHGRPAKNRAPQRALFSVMAGGA